MKILFIALLFPILCSAQTDNKTSLKIQDSISNTSFILKNEYLIFQKVFTTGLKKQELLEQLNVFLATTRDFKLKELDNENHLTGILNDFIMYGEVKGPLFGTVKNVPFHLDAKVIIQVKDFKYRVTVSEIFLKGAKSTDGKQTVDTPFDDYITIKKGSDIKIDKSSIKLLRDMDKNLTSLFDLKNSLLSEQF